MTDLTKLTITNALKGLQELGFKVTIYDGNGAIEDLMEERKKNKRIDIIEGKVLLLKFGSLRLLLSVRMEPSQL